MCNCSTVCRLLDIETSNGRWPMPRHAPMCDDYKTERFVRLIYDGSWCVMTPDDAADTIKESADTYHTEDVHLTQDQFDALPEFSGF